MNIKEFCEKYRANKIDKTISSIIKNDMYLPYEFKVTACRQVVEAAKGIDTPLMFTLFTKIVIENYTELELSDNWLVDFNDLDSLALIEKIFDKVPQHEYTRLCSVYDMVVNDYGRNLIGVVEGLAKTKK